MLLPGDQLPQPHDLPAGGRAPVANAPGKPPIGGLPVRLLAIGNSFSANALAFLPAIVEASTGNQLTLGHICIGGCPLARHWKNAEAFLKQSDDPEARAWRILTAEPWDYVTLQQYSMHSFEVETYRPYARSLYDAIAAKAPQAEVLIHETWAYREDDPLFKSGAFTPQDMYQGLRQAYETIAAELHCRIIPSGDAFENARRDPRWKGAFPDPRFDYQNARHPELPDQTHSLHSGFSWNKDKDGAWQLHMDGHHANRAGEYLGSAVWFELLFRQSVLGNAFVPKDMTAEDVAILQSIAHRTVSQGMRPALRPS